MRLILFVTTLIIHSISVAQVGNTPSEKKMCIVISGAQNDFNGALDYQLFRQKTKVGSFDCIVKNSWAEAKAHVAANLVKGSQLLLIQGAHGGRDGSYHLNAGQYPKEEVLKDLNFLAKDYKVGAVINSCFSGNLLKDKLLEDDAAGVASDQLCLLTTSSFGRISYKMMYDLADQITSAPAGIDLNSIYLSSRAGLTSAAAWNEIGLPSYFRSKSLDEGLKAIVAADSIARFDGACESLEQASSALCASPAINNEVFKMLSHFSSPIVTKEIKARFLTSLKSSALRKDPTATKCLQNLGEYFSLAFGPELDVLRFYSELRDAVKDFKTLPESKSCKAAALSLKTATEKERLYLHDFQGPLRAYENEGMKLSAMFSNRNFTQPFSFQSLAKEKASAKNECRAEDKGDIIRSMFGEEFFPDEYKEEWDPGKKEREQTPDEGILNRTMSTQVALKGFQNGSLRRKKPTNDPDRARAKACQDFKL